MYVCISLFNLVSYKSITPGFAYVFLVNLRITVVIWLCDLQKHGNKNAILSIYILQLTERIRNCIVNSHFFANIIILHVFRTL